MGEGGGEDGQDEPGEGAGPVTRTTVEINGELSRGGHNFFPMFQLGAGTMWVKRGNARRDPPEPGIEPPSVVPPAPDGTRLEQQPGPPFLNSNA